MKIVHKVLHKILCFLGIHVFEYKLYPDIGWNWKCSYCNKLIS